MVDGLCTSLGHAFSFISDYLFDSTGFCAL